jgi:purine-binding chemotaxis protein CheW
MMVNESKKSAVSYLSFRLGDELFAAPVNKVLNILEMVPITKVPKSPKYMKGVINLRGVVLPVVDARIKMNLPEVEYTSNTCILVLSINMEGESVEVGALVDGVVEVFQEEEAVLMPPPKVGNKYKYFDTIAVAKLRDQFIMLLDIEKLFAVEDVFTSSFKEK